MKTIKCKYSIFQINRLDASCRLEQLRKRCDESLQDDIFDFEQRLDNLREEIKDYALWLGEEEE